MNFAPQAAHWWNRRALTLLAAGMVMSAGVLDSGAAGAEKGKAQPVAAAPAPLRLKDSTGKAVEPLAQHGQKATLLIFLTTECPIGNTYAPEIARIAQEYTKRGVVCQGVYTHEKAEDVSRHLREYQLPLTAVLDPGLQLAHLTGATVTPEACLLGPDGALLYRGRIDDRAVKLGTVRVEPKVRDLRLALDAVLSGRPVAEKITRAIGCSISPPATSE